MTRKKAKARPDSRSQQSDAKQQQAHAGKHVAHPVVSARWLVKAIAWSLLGAAVCAWGALCLLFWQGSWQLLYHPKTAIARTPASAGIAFESVGFAATESGVLRLQGWLIPAPPPYTFPAPDWLALHCRPANQPAEPMDERPPCPKDERPIAQASPSTRYTVLYLHGQDGNVGDTVDAIARLHAAGLNVLAFDYRGYGQSEFARPSEARWLQDADWALQYMRETRHIAPSAIILDGSGLGANLALEVADKHPELAGLIMESPNLAPMSAIFSDPRASMVPAPLLVRDRFDLVGAAPALRIPSLWFVPVTGTAQIMPQAFLQVGALKQLVWLHSEANPDATYAQALSQWLGGLH